MRLFAILCALTLLDPASLAAQPERELRAEQNVDVSDVSDASDASDVEVGAAVEAVKAAVHQIFESIRTGRLDALEQQHLKSNHFTKWPDDGSPAVLGFAETIEVETVMFSAMTHFEYRIEHLRVDILEPLAIATFVIPYKASFGDDSIETAERATLVFTRSEGTWKIVHEHFSAVASSVDDSGSQ